MFARIIPNAQGMVANLITWPLPWTPLTSVSMLCLAHFFGNQLTESQRRPAGCILLKAVVPLDDFYVRPWHVADG